MKRKSNHILTVTFCAVLLALLTVFSAFGAGVIDVERNVSLTLEYKEEEKPVSGAEFILYKIADVDKDGKITPAENFDSLPVDIAAEVKNNPKALAQTLAGYIKRGSVPYVDSGFTDENGVLAFPNEQEFLETGIYLVVGEQLVRDGVIYKNEPFIVSLPGYDSETDEWVYDVRANPKHETEKPDEKLTERKIIKVWKNDKGISRPQEVSVELYMDSEIYDSAVLNEENNWTYEWKNLPKYDSDKKAIVWSVEEDVPENYKVLVENNQKTFVVTNTYTPEDNEKTTERSVQKVWDDKGYEKKRPTSVTVYLLKNGKNFDTVTLSESSGWRYTWKELEKYDESGEYITWTIREKTVPGYNADMVLNGYTFVLTNSYDRPTIPRTGVLWWPVPVLAACGILLFSVGILVKKKKENEE